MKKNQIIHVHQQFPLTTDAGIQEWIIWFFFILFSILFYLVLSSDSKAYLDIQQMNKHQIFLTFFIFVLKSLLSLKVRSRPLNDQKKIIGKKGMGKKVQSVILYEFGLAISKYRKVTQRKSSVGWREPSSLLR